MVLFVILTLSFCCHFAIGSYLMATAAGGGGSASFGNGGPATSAGIAFFYGIWADSLGNLFLPDRRMLQLRKVNTSGIISLFIGSGNLNFTGVGGPALSVNLDGIGCPYGDTAGNLYFTSAHYFIWFYNHTSGYVSRFAGAVPGNLGYSGDGGPATSAMLNGPLGVFLSTNGILYFADIGNSVIRAIDTKTNIITTIAGNQTASSLGDGGPADYAQLSPLGIWGNTAGVLYIGDNGNNRIRKVATNGIISTIVGTGNGNYNGDDLPATSADLASPYNCQEDSLGNLYISDNGNGRVRMVSAATGNITTIAGDGSSTIVNGSIHVATAVGINPSMIQLDSLGHIYVGDNSYIRMLFASTAMPSATPTKIPSVAPSVIPTAVPSVAPSIISTAVPSVAPSVIPTAVPSVAPSIISTAVPSVAPSVIPTAVPSVAPSIIPTAVPSIAPSTTSSVVPTTSSPIFTSFRPSVLNVTVDSSSKSQRLSDLHIFYATFFPAFFVGFCILPILGYYLWNFKAKKQMKYNEINLEAPSITANGNEKKTVEVSKFYEWSL